MDAEIPEPGATRRGGVLPSRESGWTLTDRFEANVQRLDVTGNFFRGGVDGFVRQLCLEKIVMRGDDVFNLRTILSLLQAQRLNQDGFVWNSGCDPFMFS